MRSVTEWTINDLNNLIRNGVTESLKLDYKASDTLKKTDGGKKELAKDVSSFANSAGGLIVIGVLEKDHKPEKLDAGVDDSLWSRESIEQVIDSNVTPRIEGLRIQAIKSAAGRTFYAIEIPQATTRAPHQVIPGRKYHKRLEFTTAEMEDYEIRDAMRRSENPNLYFDVKITSQDLDLENGNRSIELILSTRNDSTQPAFYALLCFAIDQRVEANFLGKAHEWKQAGAASGPFDDPVDFIMHHKHVMQPNHAPLFKEEQFSCGHVKVIVPAKTKKFYFFTKISCPGCLRTQAGHCIISGKEYELELYSPMPD